MGVVAAFDAQRTQELWGLLFEFSHSRQFQVNSIKSENTAFVMSLSDFFERSLCLNL